MDRLFSQGTHLLCLAVTIVNNLEEIKVEIHKTLNLFSIELEMNGNDFDSWLNLEDFQLDVLVDNGVIPSRDIYIKQWEILEHKMNTLEVLIKDLRKAQKECNDKGKEIIEKISSLPCIFLDENQKPLHEGVIIKGFSLLIGEEVDKKPFSLSSIDKLVDIQVNLDDLSMLLKKHKKFYMSLEDYITSVKVITSHTKGHDQEQMKVTLQKFEEFMK